MNKSYLSYGKDGNAVILALPLGFGLTIDATHKVWRFGSYYHAFYEFLDYGRGESEKWDWKMLYHKTNLPDGLAKSYESLLYELRKKYHNIKRPYEYECWKCPKNHIAGVMTPDEASEIREYAKVRRISWLGYLMRLGQASLYASYLRIHNRK